MPIARIISDLHLDACPMARPQKRADLAIVAGDVMNGKPTEVLDYLTELVPEKTIIYVPGNHEGYGQSDWNEMVRMLAAQSKQTKRVEFLYRRAVVIDGVRYLGATLWTDFEAFGVPYRDLAMQTAKTCMNDFRRIGVQGQPITPLMTAQLHAEDLAFLLRELSKPFNGTTVVITHHAPCLGSVAPQYKKDLLTAAFVSKVPAALLQKAHWWIHGHTHTSFDYVYEGCRIICNPRGYSTDEHISTENSAFDPELIISLDPKPHPVV